MNQRVGSETVKVIRVAHGRDLSMRCKEEEALKGEGGEGQKERYQFCILKTKLRAAIPLHLTRPLPTHRYNGVGNRVFTRYGGSGMAGDVYDYDSSDQVIGVKYGADDPHLGYAAASNPTSSAAWTYDAAGNRTLATADSDSTTYSVNAINQYTSYTLNSGTPETLSYNSRGDLAGLNGHTFEYDTFGHLVKSSDGSTVSWYYYDGEGFCLIVHNARRKIHHGVVLQLQLQIPCRF